MSIEMPFGLEDLDKVFAMAELLSNTEELLKEFYPDVKQMLVREGFFSGHTKKLYDQEFEALIIRLIKKQVINHHSDWSPEDVLLMLDPEFLKLIAEELFDSSNYKPNKEVN